MTNYLYPVTVFTARYSGTYEGAPWIAVQTHADPAMSYNPEEAHLSGCQSDDVTCMQWFDNNVHAPVGRGDTPDQAVADLARQLDIPWKPGDDSVNARWQKAIDDAQRDKDTK